MNNTIPLPPPPEYVGLRMREVLRYKKMTQKEIAEKIGISQDTMTNYVTGKSQPTWAILYTFCATIKITIDQFIGVASIDHEKTTRPIKSPRQNDIVDLVEEINEIKARLVSLENQKVHTGGSFVARIGLFVRLVRVAFHTAFINHHETDSRPTQRRHQ